MVSSMTAFASRTFSYPGGVFRWDIKSVNQRYLEAAFKLPEVFQTLEYPLRDHLRQKINRGKIYCQLQFEEHLSATPQLDLNVELLDSLIENCAAVANRLNEKTDQCPILKNIAAISPLDLLKWPHIMRPREPDLTSSNAMISEAFSNTIEDFIQARTREGSDLKGFIEQRLQMMSEILIHIHQRLPQILSDYRGRLLERLHEMKVQADANRIEQEMIFIAQKMDVAEELDSIAYTFTSSSYTVKYRRCDWTASGFFEPGVKP